MAGDGARSLSRKRSAKEELKDINRAIRAVSQKRRRLSAKIQRQESLPNPPSSKRALLVYSWSGYAFGATVDYVAGLGPAGADLSEQKKSAIFAEVERALVCLTSDSGFAASAGWRDQVTACRYVLEHRLYSWVTMQNCEFGVAPSRAQLIEQALMFQPTGAPTNVSRYMTSVLSGPPRSQRKWLARFRARWAARLGVLKIEEHVSPEEMKQKALRFHVVLRLAVEGSLCSAAVNLP